jgi:hypothetical protein
MKTAEEWINSDTYLQRYHEALIKRIQLDAIRHGMTLAAEICLRSDSENSKFDCAGLILNARDKKTTL